MLRRGRAFRSGTGLTTVLAIGAALAYPPEVQAAQLPGVLRWFATGAQVYVCRKTSGEFTWTFERPAATLADAAGAVQAEHGAGPSWTARDGSKVVGTVLTTIPAPGSGAIPWLVLQAVKHEGQGLMSDVAFVLRTDTEGGVAPSSGCDAGRDGAHTEVPYRATYTFVGAHAAS